MTADKKGAEATVGEKAWVFLAVALAVLACSGLSCHSSSSSKRDRETITALIHEWSQGYVTRDFTVLGRARADEWTYSGDANGQLLTKKQADDLLRADPTKYLSFDFPNLAIRVYYDNTGMATSLQNITVEQDNQRQVIRLMWTATFVKENGQWRAVASHTSPVTGPAPTVSLFRGRAPAM